MGHHIVCVELHSVYWPSCSRHPSSDFRNRAIRILADGGYHFRSFVPDPIRDRQLPGADAYWHRSCHITVRDAVRIFILGFSMGHARGIYWYPSDNRAFHRLGTESVYALDRKLNVNIWCCFRRLAMSRNLRVKQLLVA